MVNKVKAAVDARRDGVLIVARTDARVAVGFDSTLIAPHAILRPAQI